MKKIYSLSNKKKLEKIFTSKSDTLKFLQTRIKKSKIEKLFDFTISDWNENKKNIIKQISNNFKNKKIIIRSSAKGEDSIKKSEAGNYESILNVKANSGIEVSNAVKKVIKSYNKKGNFNIKNQILIQEQTKNIFLSGVIITRSGKIGAPYYTINYDEGDSTTSVTSGKIGKSIKIFSKTGLKLERRWRLLLESIKEVERTICSNHLDIEFAITKNWKIVIFQVRPLTSIQSHKIKKLDSIIQSRIFSYKKQVRNLKTRSDLEGDSKVFSDMADWNPAEIIGSNPNELDYSLYDFLIMNDAWRLGRKNIGYHTVNQQKLMVRFGNKPYVDVKSSFNSLIPKSINKKLRQKLMKYYLKKLSKYPYLHDKIEFEIMFSCYDFNIDKRLNELKKNGFSESEIKSIKLSLIDFTNQIISKFPKISELAQMSIHTMTKKRQLVKKKLKTGKSDYASQLDASETLLRDCRKYGTIPFSTIARIAFIGSILLKSLVVEKKLTQRSYESFMNSIETVITKFQTDLESYNTKKISKKNFLEKYGHLRPGTYDITAKRYDQNESFFSNMNSLKTKRAKIDYKKLSIGNFKESPLNFENTSMSEFVSNALIYREELKFQFTNNLSDALEYIALAAEQLGLTREDIVNLDIKTILNSYKKLTKSKLKKMWKEKITQNKKKKLYNNHLILPPIIFSDMDFEFIQYHISKPNYITSSSIISKTVKLEKNESPPITDRIVLIENADPGYDWIFTKNPSGLITKYGGIASHMAIRCAEIGLPAAIGCGELIYDRLLSSLEILLDCKNHQIMILENEETDQYTEERKVLKSLGYIK